MRYLGYVILFVVVFSILSIVLAALGHAFDAVLKDLNASDLLKTPEVKGSLTVFQGALIIGALVIIFGAFAYTKRRT